MFICSKGEVGCAKFHRGLCIELSINFVMHHLFLYKNTKSTLVTGKVNYICTWKEEGYFLFFCQSHLLKNTGKSILEGYNLEARKDTGGAPLFLLYIVLPILFLIPTQSYFINFQLIYIKLHFFIHFSRNMYDNRHSINQS